MSLRARLVVMVIYGRTKSRVMMEIYPIKMAVQVIVHLLPAVMVMSGWVWSSAMMATCSIRMTVLSAASTQAVETDSYGTTSSSVMMGIDSTTTPVSVVVNRLLVVMDLFGKP